MSGAASHTCMHAKLLQSCSTLCDPMTVAHQSPLSMRFSKQEYWSGLPCPPPRESSQPRDQTHVSNISCIDRRVLYHCCCQVASVVSDSVQPHRRQPTRLPYPWDSPGKNTGVGCHFLLQCMKVKSESEVAQSCPTLSDPIDCSPPGSSVHGIFQARVLEWGAICLLHLMWKSSTFEQIHYKYGLPW